MCNGLVSGTKTDAHASVDPYGRGHSQEGSLAGVAHLLKDNAGVLR